MAHAHDPDAVQESGNDIDAFTIGAVTVTGSFLVAAIIFAVQGLDSTMQRREMEVKGRDRVELEAYKKEQADKLAGYRWVDKDAGVAGIPLADAKKITAEKGGFTAPPPEEPAPETPSPAPSEEEGAGGGGGGEDVDAGSGGAAAAPDEEAAPEETTAPAPEAPAPEAPAPVPAAPPAPAPAPTPAPGGDTPYD